MATKPKAKKEDPMDRIKRTLRPENRDRSYAKRLGERIVKATEKKGT